MVLSYLINNYSGLYIKLNKYVVLLNLENFMFYIFRINVKIYIKFKYWLF